MTHTIVHQRDALSPWCISLWHNNFAHSLRPIRNNTRNWHNFSQLLTKSYAIPQIPQRLCRWGIWGMPPSGGINPLICTISDPDFYLVFCGVPLSPFLLLSRQIRPKFANFLSSCPLSQLVEISP